MIAAASPAAVFYLVGTLVAGALVSVILDRSIDSRNAERRARSECSSYDTLQLAGDWVAVWQTRVNGADKYYVDPVSIEQHRNLLILHNKTVEDDMEGGFLWKGELRVYDSRHLMGWYLPNQSNVMSKGVFYFVIHMQGDLIEGSWTGCSYDSDLSTGCAVMARTEERATAAMRKLRRDYKEPTARKIR